MLRSMYSGISGLRNFQTKLDVIGNNISNVNTYGFKKGRVIFKDLISQTVAGASGPGETRGGVNPKQVGLGSQIAPLIHFIRVDLHNSQEIPWILQFQEMAFCQLEDEDGTGRLYTRAGNFYMDNTGNIVSGDGKFLVGEGGDSFPNYQQMHKVCQLDRMELSLM